MVELQRFIDKYIGLAIIYLLYPFKLLDRSPKKKKRFLVVKLWALGDAVLSLVLIRALKEAYPGCNVDVLIRKRVRAVYESYDVDNIIDLDDRKFLMPRQYDYVFDCEPYLNLSAILSFWLGKKRLGFADQPRSRLYNVTTKFRKMQHMVQNYLDMGRMIGMHYDTDELEPLSVKKSAGVDKFLSRKKSERIIGITPGVAESAKSRMWYEERFAELADRLIRDGNKVVFVDGPSNKPTVEKIIGMMEKKPLDAAGKFSLKEVFYLIKQCDIFISNDTGPMHIAAAQGCQTIGLFGPNTPVLWGPYGRDNISIYKTKLKPCIQNDKGIFPDVHREGYMGPITVDDVYGTIQLMRRKRS
jgi:heptosyltransferase-2